MLSNWHFRTCIFSWWTQRNNAYIQRWKILTEQKVYWNEFWTLFVLRLERLSYNFAVNAGSWVWQRYKKNLGGPVLRDCCQLFEIFPTEKSLRFARIGRDKNLIFTGSLLIKKTINMKHAAKCVWSFTAYKKILTSAKHVLNAYRKCLILVWKYLF